MKPDYGEPWSDSGKQSATGGVAIDTGRGAIVIVGATKGVRDRLIATVNACAGLSDEELKRVKAVNEMAGIIEAVYQDLGNYQVDGGMPVSDETYKRILALRKADRREP